MQKTLFSDKFFKTVAGALFIMWITLLTVNVFIPAIVETNIFDSNAIDNGFVLSDEDNAKINLLKEAWSQEDTMSNVKLRAEKALEAFNHGDFENSIELYNESLAIGDFENDNYVTLLMNLGLAYEAIGDSTNAIRTYRIVQNKVSESSPTFNVAEGKIALLGEYMDVNLAIVSFEKATKLDKNNFEANNTLALIYMGEYGSEFTDFKTALTYNKLMSQIAPDNINVRINLAITYTELGQLSEAKTNLDHALTLQPKSIPANYLMMKTLYLLNDIKDAKIYANKIVNWYPDFKNDKLVAEIIGSK